MQALRDSFTLGVLLYGLLLAITTGGLFFAVVPSLTLYVVGNLNLKDEEAKELTYQDILLFKNKQEILDFLSGKQRQTSFLKQVDYTKTFTVFGLAMFFATVFAYAYTIKAFVSLLALPLLIKRRQTE